MKLKKFLCLFLLIAAVFALASCEVLGALGGGTTTTETEEFEVKFDSAKGSDVASQTVAKGGLVTEPKEPTREGYSFVGWYRGGKLWNFEEDTVTRAITLIAKWEKVVVHEHAFSAPTCTEPGMCECGEIGDVALGHNWLDATCDTPKTCSECKLTEGEANGHTPGAEATCSAPQICTVCEEELNPALAHTEITVDAVPATCTEAGLTAGVKCDVCDHVILAQEVVEALGHTEVTVDAVPATCTEAGLTAGVKCNVCEHVITEQEEVEALGHSYVEVVTEPTCEEGGYTTKTCSVCDDVVVDGHTEALGHSYVEVVTEPTCEEGGYTTKTCSVCDDVVVDGHTEALGHSYVEVVTEPTCEEGGYTTKTCSVCDDVVVDGHTEALGHSYVDGVCTNCSETISHYVNYYVWELGNDPVYSEKFFEDTGLEALYAFEKTGYSVSAWQDIFGAEYTSIPVGTEEDVDLYCSITPINYTITYVVNGEVHTTATYNVESAVTLIEVPAILGLSAKGWADADGNFVTEIALGTTGDFTFTAVYAEITYTVTYVLNGGENHADNVTEFSPASVPTLYNPLTRDGYLFEGWYTDAEFTNLITTLEDVDSDVTLYAKWTAHGGDNITPEAPLA